MAAVALTWSRSKRSLCALVRFISSSSALICSSCRSYFDLGRSLLRNLSSAFPTESLGVSAIDNPQIALSRTWGLQLFRARSRRCVRSRRHGIERQKRMLRR
jgi:hypothetical protein